MKIKKKNLALLTIAILVLIGLIGVLFKYLLAIYYVPIAGEFLSQNLKPEYRKTEVSLSPIYPEYGAPEIIIGLRLYNWYNFDWEKDNIRFKVLYRPNLDIILAIEDTEVQKVDVSSAYDKAAKYFLLPDNLDFECNLGVCLTAWEKKHLAIGKIEGQDITIVLAKELK
jgi:hypothetical protein